MPALKLYRCLNCKREFEADKPACEPCGLDPAKNPRDAQYVAELTVVHFDPPTKVVGRGKNYAACDPRLKIGRPDTQFTGEPTAVTCKACKAVAEYRAAETGETPVGAVAAPLRLVTGAG